MNLENLVNEIPSALIGVICGEDLALKSPETPNTLDQPTHESIISTTFYEI